MTTKNRSKTKILIITMNDLIVKAQALATVTEDQFEASLAELVTAMQAFQPTSEPVATGVTTVSLTQNLSDGTSVVFSVLQV